MYAYQNMKSQKGSERKVTSQTKTNVVSFGNQSFSETITQRAEKREEHMNDLHSILSDRIRRSTENRTGLPDRLKSGIESLSGFSMDDVRVHYHSPKPAQLQAYAYTRGMEIYVAPGQEKHLPHEAWHVVQQMQGRVRPTERINGESVNTSFSLEREASEMGRRILNEPVSELSAALVQRQPSDEAAQLVSHVRLGRCDRYGGISLTPNEKPTIVFESMSKSGREAQSVFNETKKYFGNTICVFGLNDRDQMPAVQIRIADEPPHFFRSFDFQWSRPDRGAGENRYMMPFIEARKLVMQEAEKIVNCAKAAGGLPADNPAGKFIYRWIDGDATEDQSEQIPKESLDLLTDGGMAILSGTYKWRSNASRTQTHYLEFIDKVNEAEKRLRTVFYYTYGKLSDCFNYDSALPEFIGDRGELSSYYLPETSFMMSETAHNVILNGDYRAYENDEQTKESMKMLFKANIPRNLVAFERSFSISKPLKGEFSDDDENYLGIGMLRLLKENAQCSFDDFYVELCKMRQSVFEKFTLADGLLLPNNKTYEELKRYLAQEIYNYYAANYQQISGELSGV